MQTRMFSYFPCIMWIKESCVMTGWNSCLISWKSTGPLSDQLFFQVGNSRVGPRVVVNPNRLAPLMPTCLMKVQLKIISVLIFTSRPLTKMFLVEPPLCRPWPRTLGVVPYEWLDLFARYMFWIWFSFFIFSRIWTRLQKNWWPDPRNPTGFLAKTQPNFWSI